MGMAAVILAASTLLSRFMGLIRDKVISWQFGAGSEADMSFAAFVVPDIINYLLAGGFMSITLIPLLSRRFDEDEADGWHFFSCVLSWMGLAALALTLLGMSFASSLAHLVAPGLEPEGFARLTLFMRIVLPAQFFFLTGSCLMSLLYLRRQFAIPALTPLIYNGCIILLGILLPASGLAHGMSGYCVGVTVGAALGTFVLPLCVARQRGLHYTPCFRHPLFKKFLLLSLPLMLGQTIAALDEQFLRIFGSLAGSGCVSLLNYAKRVSQVPVALIGQVAAVASYPFLVSLLTKGETGNFTRVLGGSLRAGLGIIVPLSLWMCFLADSTFTLLFYGGRMSAAEMVQSLPLLQIMLAGVPFWFVYAVLVRGYYARTDTLTPAVCGTVLTVLFLPVYAFLAVPYGGGGIALTSVLSMVTYVCVLVVIWAHRWGGIFSGGCFLLPFVPVLLRCQAVSVLSGWTGSSGPIWVFRPSCLLLLA